MLKNSWKSLTRVFTKACYVRRQTVERNICSTYDECQSIVNKNGGEVVKARGNPVSFEVSEWSPLEMTNGSGFTFGNYALVVLNTSIKVNSEEMVSFWNKAAFRVTVDGGTDYWYSFKKNLTSYTKLVREDPDFITGDFDSIDRTLLDSCYKNTNITIISTPDQNHTDFTKSLEQIIKTKKNYELDSILVIVEHSDRLDKILSNVQTLFRAEDILGPKLLVFLLTKNSLTWLLRPGNHRIRIPMRLWRQNSWCGLLPLSGPTVVTTTGLKWNLNKQVLRFGELISTSNTYGEKSLQSEGVSVQTDKEIIWTMATRSEE